MTQQHSIQFATRISAAQAQKFKEYTAALGTTPSDAMRILIAAFVQNKGFPCEIKLPQDTEKQDIEMLGDN